MDGGLDKLKLSLFMDPESGIQNDFTLDQIRERAAKAGFNAIKNNKAKGHVWDFIPPNSNDDKCKISADIRNIKMPYTNERDNAVVGVTFNPRHFKNYDHMIECIEALDTDDLPIMHGYLSRIDFYADVGNLETPYWLEHFHVKGKQYTELYYEDLCGETESVYFGKNHDKVLIYNKTSEIKFRGGYVENESPLIRVERQLSKHSKVKSLYGRGEGISRVIPIRLSELELLINQVLWRNIKPLSSVDLIDIHYPKVSSVSSRVKISEIGMIQEACRLGSYTLAMKRHENKDIFRSVNKTVRDASEQPCELLRQGLIKFMNYDPAEFTN